jgi:hypothetical protein
LQLAELFPGDAFKKAVGIAYLLMDFSTNATTPKKPKFPDPEPSSNLYDGKSVRLFGAAPRQRMGEGLG